MFDKTKPNYNLITTFRHTQASSSQTPVLSNKYSVLTSDDSDSTDFQSSEEDTYPPIHMADPPTNTQQSNTSPTAPTVEHTEDETFYGVFERMAENNVNTPQKHTGGPWFTIDDIPHAKRRSRLMEFYAWLELQVDQGMPLQDALQEFTTRFVGTLKDWWLSVNNYSKLVVLRSETIQGALAWIYREFVGKTDDADETARNSSLQKAVLYPGNILKSGDPMKETA